MLCGVPPFYSKDREQLYSNIKYSEPKLDYPFLTESARDLCINLLQKDPSKRIGNRSGGMFELKEHPWFESINWKKLEEKKIIPPYKPQLDNGTDTRHFPKEFTAMMISP
jgi:serum/glucocorticoid-regulated kinase 2